jgi:hypothetical protein
MENSKEDCIREILSEEFEPGLFPNIDDPLNIGLYKSKELSDWQQASKQ